MSVNEYKLQSNKKEIICINKNKISNNKEWEIANVNLELIKNKTQRITKINFMAKEKINFSKFHKRMKTNFLNSKKLFYSSKTNHLNI